MMDPVSEEKLRHVDPQLASVIVDAAQHFEGLYPYLRVRVTSGFRTREEQFALYLRKRSRTTHSAHMQGMACDVAIIRGHTALWELAWFRRFNASVQRSSQTFRCEVGWGGDWASFRDGCHFYLLPPGELSIPTALAGENIATRPAKDRAARTTRGTAP